MILIIGRAKAAVAYAAARRLPVADTSIVTRDVRKNARGLIPTELVLVDGWSEVVDAKAGAYLRVLMATGKTRWVSGVTS